MRWLKRLAAILTIIVLLQPLLGLAAAQAQPVVEERGTAVYVNTGVAELSISLEGGRPVSWLVDGVELAANAGSRGAMGKSYPLYDWLPTQSWPGLIVSAKFTAEVERPQAGVAVVRLKAEIPVTSITGTTGRVQVTREYVFTQGKRAFTVKVTLLNLGTTPLVIEVNWDGARIGYTFAVTGVVGTSKDNDWQLWVDGNTLHTRDPNQRESWVRRKSSTVRVIGIYDPEEKGIMLARLHNATAALWLEADVWGLEVRAEYPTLQLKPGAPVTFIYTVYGGSPDNLDVEGFADVKALLRGEAPPAPPAVERSPPSMPQPTGVIKYSLERDSVLVDTGVARLLLSLEGGRPVSWLVDGVELAANAGSRGAMGKSYPLYDWLPTQSWPGLIVSAKFTAEVERFNGTVLVLKLSASVPFTTAAGDQTVLAVTKRFTFYAGLYGFDQEVTISNAGKVAMESKVVWDRTIGYTFAVTGVIGARGEDDWQAWEDSSGVHLLSPSDKLHFTWKSAPDLLWIGMLDPGENAGIIAYLVTPGATVAWLEASTWGTEVRAEYPPFALKPGESVTFKYRVFGGPLDRLADYGYPHLHAQLASALAALALSFNVTTDKLFYAPGETVRVTVSAAYRRGAATGYLDYPGGRVALELSPKPTTRTLEVRAQSAQGVQSITLTLAVEQITATREVRIGVVDKAAWGDPLKLVFVWHHHQGINMWPNGTFHGPWAFTHTYEDEFKPYYEGGAYLVQAKILSKYPAVKMVYHLSPSLLWQWEYGLKYGFYDGMSGRFVAPDSAEMRRVAEALQAYKQLAARGQIEIFSDFFNHPIPGYVVDTYPWGARLMEIELEWGFAVTQRVLGVRPKGAWIPEMFFSEKLVPILARHGVQYIVLDSETHYKGSSGDKRGIYTPYLYQFESYRLVVLFRDAYLSNVISFENRFQTPQDADAAARNFVLAVASRRFEDPSAEVVVIAADGENWMIFSPTVATTGIFFESLCRYLTEARGIVDTATVEEVASKTSGLPVLRSIPTASWAGGSDVWTGSPEQRQQQWPAIDRAASLIQSIESNYGSESRVYKAALFAIFMALNSDVIHRSFLFVPHTTTWAEVVSKLYQLGEEQAAKLDQLGLNLEAERIAPSGPPAGRPPEQPPVPQPSPGQPSPELPPATFVALALIAAAIAVGAALILAYARSTKKP
ncbi:MAG: hypothetical protein QXD46_06800 [Thermofilum sp.]